MIFSKLCVMKKSNLLLEPYNRIISLSGFFPETASYDTTDLWCIPYSRGTPNFLL
jgi:hypothetical protein